MDDSCWFRHLRCWTLLKDIKGLTAQQSSRSAAQTEQASHSRLTAEEMDDSKTTATVEGDASTKEAEKAASAVPAAVSTESKGDSAEAGAESTGGNEQQDAKIGAAEVSQVK